MYRIREPYNDKKQYNVLMKIIKKIELYEDEDLKVLTYLKEKGFLNGDKINDKGIKYILFIEKTKFDMKKYGLYMFIIFGLPFILIILGKYIPIDGIYGFYFYFFMITFGIFFLMKSNSKKRKEHIDKFKHKYFN